MTPGPRPRRGRGRTTQVAGAVAAVMVGIVLLLPGSSSAVPGAPDQTGAPRHESRPDQVPLDVCIDAHLDLIDVVLDLGMRLRVGGPGTACPPPPTTTTTAPLPTTTTTTATTAPPQGPPPTTAPTTTTTTPPQPRAVSPTTTGPPTTTTTTTTTTAPPPPPPDPPPPPAQLAARVTMAPDPAEAGQPATATIAVQNLGGTPASAVTLVDEVSPAAGIRSATTPGGACATASRRATCELGTIPAGGQSTVEVRLVVAEEPSSRTIVQRISLSSGGSVEAGTTTASTLLAAEEPSASLLALPGTTVTLVAFVGFVLAARSTR